VPPFRHDPGGGGADDHHSLAFAGGDVGAAYSGTFTATGDDAVHVVDQRGQFAAGMTLSSGGYSVAHPARATTRVSRAMQRRLYTTQAFSLT